jgi:hypothetical protein
VYFLAESAQMEPLTCFELNTANRHFAFNCCNQAFGAWGTVAEVTLPLETLPKQHNSDAAITGELRGSRSHESRSFFVDDGF